MHISIRCIFFSVCLYFFFLLVVWKRWVNIKEVLTFSCNSLKRAVSCNAASRLALYLLRFLNELIKSLFQTEQKYEEEAEKENSLFSCQTLTRTQRPWDPHPLQNVNSNRLRPFSNQCLKSIVKQAVFVVEMGHFAMEFLQNKNMDVKL